MFAVVNVPQVAGKAPADPLFPAAANFLFVLAFNCEITLDGMTVLRKVRVVESVVMATQ